MAFDTVSDLLAHIAQLPDDRQFEARDRVARAIERPAPAARAALGLLALDLAVDVDASAEAVDPSLTLDPALTVGAPVVSDGVIVVPELVPDRASA